MFNRDRSEQVVYTSVLFLSQRGLQLTAERIELAYKACVHGNTALLKRDLILFLHSPQQDLLYEQTREHSLTPVAANSTALDYSAHYAHPWQTIVHNTHNQTSTFQIGKTGEASLASVASNMR